MKTQPSQLRSRIPFYFDRVVAPICAGADAKPVPNFAVNSGSRLPAMPRRPIRPMLASWRPFRRSIASLRSACWCKRGRRAWPQARLPKRLVCPIPRSRSPSPSWQRLAFVEQCREGRSLCPSSEHLGQLAALAYGVRANIWMALTREKSEVALCTKRARGQITGHK